MDIIYSRGSATASEVVEDMADAPSRTSVRTFLRILEEKGFLNHKKRGREFVYRPTRRRGRVGQSAMRRVLTTFFDGSLADALAAHLADPKTEISAEESKRLARLIKEVRDTET